MTEEEKTTVLDIYMQGFVDGVSAKEYTIKSIRDFVRPFPVSAKLGKEEYRKGLAAGLVAWQEAVDKVRERLDYRSVSYVMDEK